MSDFCARFFGSVRSPRKMENAPDTCDQGSGGGGGDLFFGGEDSIREIAFAKQ